MSSRLLDGTAIAAAIKEEIKLEVQKLAANGAIPGLAVVLIGDNPASAIYVRNKVKACQELGIHSVLLTPDPGLTTNDLLLLIDALNGREDIDGILVQLPLPKQIETRRILEAVDPAKDVDGFHPINVGRLHAGQECLVPCTPAGIMEIVKRSHIAVEGVDAVVVGRSDIVGKPTSAMLLNGNATVTTCHIKTVDLRKYTREADLLIVAIGHAGFITPDYVKPGAVMIDVGINRVTDAALVRRFFPGDSARSAAYARRGSIVMGDIAPQALALSSAYTPVPGGVGALTIAMLMHNTVKAAKQRRGLL